MKNFVILKPKIFSSQGKGSVSSYLAENTAIWEL
jgi:hypothetical protein